MPKFAGLFVYIINIITVSFLCCIYPSTENMTKIWLILGKITVTW